MPGQTIFFFAEDQQVIADMILQTGWNS